MSNIGLEQTYACSKHGKYPCTMCPKPQSKSNNKDTDNG